MSIQMITVNPVQELKIICERAALANLKRRRDAFACIAGTIPEAKDRLYPFFNEELATLNWKKVFQAQWSEDERQALEWLRSMWEGKMYVKTRKYCGLFPDNWEMKQAVCYALSLSSFTYNMIDDFYQNKYSRKEALSESNLVASA